MDERSSRPDNVKYKQWNRLLPILLQIIQLLVMITMTEPLLLLVFFSVLLADYALKRSHEATDDLYRREIPLIIIDDVRFQEHTVTFSGSSQCPCAEDNTEDDNFLLEIIEAIVVTTVTAVNDYIWPNAAPIPGPVPTVREDVAEVIRFEGNLDDVSEDYSTSSNESIIPENDNDFYSQTSYECTESNYSVIEKIVCGKVPSHNYTTAPIEELVCGKELACDTPSKLNPQPRGEYSDHVDHILVVCASNLVKIEQLSSAQEINEPMPNMLTSSDDSPEHEDTDGAKAVDQSAKQPAQHTKPSSNAAMNVFPYPEVTYLMGSSSATPTGVAVFNGIPLCSIQLLDGEFVCGIGDFKKKESSSKTFSSPVWEYTKFVMLRFGNHKIARSQKILHSMKILAIIIIIPEELAIVAMMSEASAWHA